MRLLARARSSDTLPIFAQWDPALSRHLLLPHGRNLLFSNVLIRRKDRRRAHGKLGMLHALRYQRASSVGVFRLVGFASLSSTNTLVGREGGRARPSSLRRGDYSTVARHQGRLLMTPRNGQAPRGRTSILLGSLRVLLVGLLIGVTPLTAAGFSIYESAPTGPLALNGDPPPVIVADQYLGVKFHVSKPVRTGSIGGYFAPYAPGVEADIIGAIVKLDGPHDFPNSFDLTTNDVLGKTLIHISEPAGDFAGELSLTLTEGWYALVFAATGRQDKHNAVMLRMDTPIEYPLYFFGRVLDPDAPEWFAYLDGGGLDGVRMFVVTDPVPPVLRLPPARLGSGLGGLGGSFGGGIAVSGVHDR